MSLATDLSQPDFSHRLERLLTSIPMNLSKLLANRDSLVAQMRLANLAFAYATLKHVADVVRRARLSGVVRLQQPSEKEERLWAALSAVESSQAVLDEHFSEDDVVAFADAVALVVPGNEPLDVTLRIHDLDQDFVQPLRAALLQAGVELDAWSEAEVTEDLE